jgi:hypothetical protein
VSRFRYLADCAAKRLAIIGRRPVTGSHGSVATWEGRAAPRCGRAESKDAEASGVGPSVGRKELGIVRATRRVLISIVLVVGCGLLSSCGPAQSTASSTSTMTGIPTQSAAITDMPSSSQTALPSLVGKWERHGKQDGRPYTEHFALNPDGTYSIEARFDDNAEVLASASGTYEATDTTLTMTDTDGATTTSPYYLDVLGRLVIDNKTELAWTRVP